MAFPLQCPSSDCTVAREVGGGGGVAKSTEIEQKKAEHFYQVELTDWRMGSLWGGSNSEGGNKDKRGSRLVQEGRLGDHIVLFCHIVHSP